MLIVEDDADSLSLMLELLKRIGLECDVARDGLQALQKGRDNSYQLILMDLVLPGMTGFDVTRLIRRENGPNAECPILAITALTSQDDTMRCMHSGITEIIKKPLMIHDFRKKVTAYLDAKHV